jgi:uncharacterized protein YbjQ (UPF0145 family)
MSPDLAAELRRGAQSLVEASPTKPGRGVTSDLSIDGALLLHAAGWEPLDLACGVGVASVPYGSWSSPSNVLNWGSSTQLASEACNAALDVASQELRDECTRVQAHGVVGVELQIEVHTHHVEVDLVGTAIRPITGEDPHGKAAAQAMPFVSDLSARDFTLLLRAGWMPLTLAFGASFVYASRRSAGAAIRQSSQNVELTNFTEAMYSAREQAMDRMQQLALHARAQGIVGVKVREGPMSFASRAVSFMAWGTAVRLVEAAHRSVQPEVVLPVDDALVMFEARSLRGGG